MNWKKLKEKFPKSYKEIREFYLNQKNKDSRFVIDSFLITKGYKSGFTFIHNLKDYENKQEENNKVSRCCGRCDGVNDVCVTDIICEKHNDTGCEICFG